MIQQDTRNELHDDFKQTDMAEMQMNGGINTNKESNLQESWEVNKRISELDGPSSFKNEYRKLSKYEQGIDALSVGSSNYVKLRFIRFDPWRCYEVFDSAWRWLDQVMPWNPWNINNCHEHALTISTNIDYMIL